MPSFLVSPFCRHVGLTPIARDCAEHQNTDLGSIYFTSAIIIERYALFVRSVLLFYYNNILVGVAKRRLA